VEVKHWHGPEVKTNELFKLVQDAIDLFEVMGEDIQEIK